MRHYSRVVSPMTSLLDKVVRFQWPPTADAAFRSLREAFTSAPVIDHFDPSLPCILETEASDFVAAAVLSQKDNQAVLHPVAFCSYKITPAKCNYEIYDKELLAIVRSFEEWRKYLEPSDTPIIVYCNHKNLEYFMSTEMLNRQQARWALTLATIKCIITYQPGPCNGKPHALTRRSGDLPGEGDERLTQQQQVLLKPANLHLPHRNHDPRPPIQLSATKIEYESTLLSQVKLPCPMTPSPPSC